MEERMIHPRACLKVPHLPGLRSISSSHPKRCRTGESALQTIVPLWPELLHCFNDRIAIGGSGRQKDEHDYDQSHSTG